MALFLDKVPAGPIYAGYQLIVEFTWTIDESDLDTSIEMFGESEGFDCDGSKYMSFTGDNPDEGGFEKYTVDIGRAAIDNNRANVFLSFKAHWFDRMSFAPATLYVFLVNENGVRVATTSPLFIRPGADLEKSCSPNIVATANVKLQGTPTITLMPRIPTQLELIANITGSDRMVTAAKYAGETSGPSCDGTAKYIEYTSKVTPGERKDSYVLYVSRAKTDGILGSESVAEFFSSLRSGDEDRDLDDEVKMGLYLQDGSGRRYPVVYKDQVIELVRSSATCPSSSIATADIIYSDSQVKLDASF